MHLIRCVSSEATMRGATHKKTVPEQRQREPGIGSSEGEAERRREIEKGSGCWFGAKGGQF